MAESGNTSGQLKTVYSFTTGSIMKRTKLIFLILSVGCSISVSLVTGCNYRFKQANEPTVFRAFIKCETTSKDKALIADLRAKATPIEKQDGLRIYSYKTKILGLNSDKIILGVCENGSADCGWGGFMAFQLNQSVPSAKSALLKSYNIDFTRAQRSGQDAAEVTLRPVLSKNTNSGETWLFCDPGTL